MTLLLVDDLAVRYGGAVLALDGVSFEVPEGGSVALLGANGAGKTTVLRAVSGLLRFNRGAIIRGSVRVDGRPVDGRDTTRLVASGVSQVLEGRRIFRDLTVAENLRAGGMGAGRRGNETQTRERVFELFPILRERLDQPGGLLSGGEQSMLAIGRALMARPRLLLLDEPSLGLAPLVVRQIGEALTRINAEGVAVLLVDQSTALALQATRHAYLLETGRVVHHAGTAELLADPKMRASYLGTQAADSSLRTLIEDAAS